MNSLCPAQENALVNIDKCLDHNSVCYLSCIDSPLAIDTCRKYGKSSKYSCTTAGYDLLLQGVETSSDLNNHLKKMKTRLIGITGSTQKYPGLVLIDNFNDMITVTTAYYFTGGAITHLIWTDFFENSSLKFLISSTKGISSDMVSLNSWSVNLSFDENDRLFCLREMTQSEEEAKAAFIYSKSADITDIIQCSKQATVLKDKNKSWVEDYKDKMSLLDSGILDVKEEVVKPEFEIDMVGLEETMQILEDEIIVPIKEGNIHIPVCKGLLLYGPPGTGKSTIGRWLSYKLEGRVYLAEETSQESLISSFKHCFKRARANKPSIVFVDDFEVLLKSENTIREILVLLDGINVKGRNFVTVVVTAMNISEIPEALIRGGRLEKCIEFKKPNHSQIKAILRNKLKSSIDGLKETGSGLGMYLDKNIPEYFVEAVCSVLVGWTPANISLLIDTLVRKANIMMKTPETRFDSVKYFRDEACRVREIQSKASQNVYYDETDKVLLYT